MTASSETTAIDDREHVVLSLEDGELTLAALRFAVTGESQTLVPDRSVRSEQEVWLIGLPTTLRFARDLIGSFDELDSATLAVLDVPVSELTLQEILDARPYAGVAVFANQDRVVMLLFDSDRLAEVLWTANDVLSFPDEYVTAAGRALREFRPPARPEAEDGPEGGIAGTCCINCGGPGTCCCSSIPCSCGDRSCRCVAERCQCQGSGCDCNKAIDY